MTLHTQILLTRPATVTDVHAFVNAELLDAPDARHGGVQSDGEGELTIRNERGQGLNALAWLTFHADGPISATRLVGDHPVTGHEVHEEVARGSVLVHLDSGYGGGYGPHGAQVEDFHAWAIVQLARRFGPVVWVKEYDGLWSHLEDGHHLDAGDVLAFSLFGDPEAYEPGCGALIAR